MTATVSRTPEQLAASIARASIRRSIEDIVEENSSDFDRLLTALHRRRSKDLVSLEDKIKTALPEKLHAEFVKLLDGYSADNTAYLDAGYLIGLAMGKGGAL